MKQKASQKITALYVKLSHDDELQVLGLWQNREIKDPCRWTSSTIAGILAKPKFLGHTINFKTRKHFTDKKSHYVDKSEWQIFKNTQEPIADQETFDNVQRIRSLTENDAYTI